MSDASVGKIELNLVINHQQFNKQLADIQQHVQQQATKQFSGIQQQTAQQLDGIKQRIARQFDGIQQQTSSRISGIRKHASRQMDGFHQQAAKQLGGIQKMAALAGKAMAAVFVVKKLVGFGKACMELGSNLEEVQNVVDVTFTTMADKVNEFAKSAMSSFGLSETMAKKYVGLYGAMSKSFGFTEKQAYAMSTALTGLAGDVASFYNLDQDLAYTKLKSVFSGETEALKDLGIVMTQSALDAYALANGFGKTTKSMSEMEKVSLRLAFVQSNLAGAQGDFARTTDSWANQTRILTLQFESLKATIGQGLINLFTPIIKVVNTLIGKLLTLANAFKAFTEMVSGKKAQGSATGISAVADAADSAADATAGIGDAAKKSAKALKSLAKFDELNVLSSPSGGGGDEGVSGGYNADSFSVEPVDTESMEEAASKFQTIIDKARELAGLFKEGFWKGFGDTSVFDSIHSSAKGIKESLIEIFTDIKVKGAAEDFSKRFVKSLGEITGSALSIGASIADNLTGGLALYLKSSSGRIKDYLVSMFDIGGRKAEILAGFMGALSTIFEAFRSGSAKQITSDIIGIFTDGFMGASELVGNIMADILDMVTGPFIANKDSIKGALEETFSGVEPIFTGIRDFINETFHKIQTTYEEHVRPVFISFKDGFTELGEKALELYRKYIVPAISRISEKFTAFKEKSLGPMVDKFCDFVAKASEAITVIWENYLKPFCAWFMEHLYPVIAEAIDLISSVFFNLSGGIFDALGEIWNALSGLMDFIIGVFTGDWERAWDGIKDFFTGIWNAIYSVLKGILDSIWEIIKLIFNNVKDFLQNIWESIKKKLFDTFNSIRDKVSSIFSKTKEIIVTAFTSVKDSIVDLWNKIKSFITTTIDTIKTGISTALDGIRSIWGNIWNSMKETVTDIFTGIWNGIKGIINNIIGGIEKMANSVIGGINSMIGALNNISFSIPDWVPGLGGKTFGLSIPTIPSVSIPRLAQGGYVKANTPQLAMIGDNRHQGEIVAPEDKIYEVSFQAITDAMRPLLAAIMELAQQRANGNNGEVRIVVSGELAPLFRLLKVELDKEDRRMGMNFEVVSS